MLSFGRHPRHFWLPFLRAMLLFVVGISSLMAGWHFFYQEKSASQNQSIEPALSQKNLNFNRVNLANLIRYWLEKNNFSARSLLHLEFPLWQDSKEEEKSGAARKKNQSWEDLLCQLAMKQSPASFLVSASSPIPHPSVPPTATSKPVSSPATSSGKKEKLSRDVLVAIYHTHTSESYRPSDGADHLTRQRGGVVQVGEELKKILEEKYGIRTAHSDKIHDYFYNYSYVESEVTARELVTQYPRLTVLIDLHRDGNVPREYTTAEINGKKTARIMLVMGSNRRLEHPRWQENLAFARELDRRLQARYPGLSRGIRLEAGRYNQHLHPHALLIEVGGSENTREEAIQAVIFLAEVLAEMIGSSRE